MMEYITLRLEPMLWQEYSKYEDSQCEPRLTSLKHMRDCMHWIRLFRKTLTELWNIALNIVRATVVSVGHDSLL